MTPARRPTPAPDQAGFALIEVVVSALIAVLMTGAVLSLLNSTGRAGASERRKSQAFSIAQEDQARLRSTRITDLDTTMAPQAVTLNGIRFEVKSTATFVSDKTGTTSCGSESRSDYVKLGSEVTWQGMGTAAPVQLESIVSPVSGSLDPTHGSLAVTVNNGAVPAGGLSGVAITGTGPGGFSGSSDSNGCALFGGQPAGEYTVTPTLGSEYVDVNGKAPKAEKVQLTPGSTATLPLVYDRFGTVQVGFTVKSSSSSATENSYDDAVTALATGLTSGAKIFGTPGGTLVRPITATPLFPFSYSYNFYGGSCSTNKPEEGSANVLVTRGGTFAATVQLPALYLTVKNSSNVNISGAKVTAIDTQCSVGTPAVPVKREYTTTASGNLPNPGLSWSTYDLCASALISTTVRHVNVSGVVVHSLAGTSLTMTIPSSGSSSTGACP
jgi:type II secretory pathway pseudopilin PulG